MLAGQAVFFGRREPGGAAPRVEQRPLERRQPLLIGRLPADQRGQLQLQVGVGQLGQDRCPASTIWPCRTGTSATTPSSGAKTSRRSAGCSLPRAATSKSVGTIASARDAAGQQRPGPAASWAALGREAARSPGPIASRAAAGTGCCARWRWPAPPRCAAPRARCVSAASRSAARRAAARRSAPRSVAAGNALRGVARGDSPSLPAGTSGSTATSRACD